MCPLTIKYLENELRTLKFNPIRLEKGGLLCGCGQGSKTILLRADIDGLPITEETNLEFKSTNGLIMPVVMIVTLVCY